MTTAAPFACHIVGPDHELATRAVALERAVFLETFGNTPELLADQYGPFDDTSAYIVVVDQLRDRVAGMIRLVLDGNGSLKSLVDVEVEPWSVPVPTVLADSGLDDFDPSRALDVATLAVDPEYRGAAAAGLVSMALYQSVLTVARRADMGWLVTILDVVVLDLIQTRLRDIFRPYVGVEPKRYLDSPSSVPVFSDLAEYSDRLRSVDPDLHEMVFEGIGLEPVVAPPDWVAAGDLVAGLTSRDVIDLTDDVEIDLRDGAGTPAGPTAPNRIDIGR